MIESKDPIPPVVKLSPKIIRLPDSIDRSYDTLSLEDVPLVRPTFFIARIALGDEWD